jgi:hypothetical protein
VLGRRITGPQPRGSGKKLPVSLSRFQAIRYCFSLTTKRLGSSGDVAIGSVRLALVVAPDVATAVAAVVVYVCIMTDRVQEPPCIGTEGAGVFRRPRLRWHEADRRLSFQGLSVQKRT